MNLDVGAGSTLMFYMVRGFVANHVSADLLARRDGGGNNDDGAVGALQRRGNPLLCTEIESMDLDLGTGEDRERFGAPYLPNGPLKVFSR